MNKRLETKQITKERRNLLNCKTFTCKIDKSKLSKQKLNILNGFFIEGKWLYNHIIANINQLDSINTKIKAVPVKIQDQYEIRNFNYIPASSKQDIKQKVWTSLKSLSTKKKQGKKVGKLKFKSQLNAISLRQYNANYKIKNKKVQIPRLGWININGLKQLPKDVEFANATLLKKTNDYYIKITTFIPKKVKELSNTSIGIDFGCNTQLTLDNNIKIKFEIPIPKKLRLLDRKIQKNNRKRSNNKYKDQIKRQKLYERIVNKKKDIKNKLVNILTSNYKTIIIQDENVHAWQSNHGKKIQNTAIGGIISDLKRKSHTLIIVDKFFPSTKLCPKCNIKNEISLNDRTYACNNCGYVNDRDVKAAIYIKEEGLKHVPMDHREFKLEEMLTSIIFDKLSKINYVKVSKSKSLNQEASN